MLKTIKFPTNLKSLNEKLPKPKYINYPKSSKLLPEGDGSSTNIKSMKSIPSNDLPRVRTEKHLPPSSQITSNGKSIREILAARKKEKGLKKVGSQKYIY